jgi:NAD(P)-dependent dehydrogenase (short-subunit alcohol dehydrogenase family)
MRCRLTNCGSSDEAQSLVAEIRKKGGRADAIATDLAATDGAHTLAAQICTIVGNRLDILVANAGVSTFSTIEEERSIECMRVPMLRVGSPATSSRSADAQSCNSD